MLLSNVVQWNISWLWYCVCTSYQNPIHQLTISTLSLHTTFFLLILGSFLFIINLHFNIDTIDMGSYC